MIRHCAYCEKEGKDPVMGEKAPLEDRSITHGICEAHVQALIEDAARVMGKPKKNPCTTGMKRGGEERRVSVVDEVADGPLRKKRKSRKRRRHKR